MYFQLKVGLVVKRFIYVETIQIKYLAAHLWCFLFNVSNFNVGVVSQTTFGALHRLRK